MEDAPHAINMPLKLSNVICDEFDLIARTESLFLDPTFIKLPLVIVASESICYNYNNHKTGVCARVISTQEMKEKDTVLNVTKVEMHNESTLISSDTINQDSSRSQSVVSYADRMCGEQCRSLTTNSVAEELVNTDSRMSVDKTDFLESDSSSEIVVDVVAVNNADIDLSGPSNRLPTTNLEGTLEKKMNTAVENIVIAVSDVDVETDVLKQESTTVLLDGMQEKKNMCVGDSGVAVNSIDMETYGSKQIVSAIHLESIQKNTMKSLQKHNLFNYVPKWGFTSLQGRRSEMEDAVVAIPCLLEIPTPMLTLISNEFNQTLSQSTAHFFGVYDGHGGCKVANYCRDRIHLALAEELTHANEHSQTEIIADNWQEQLENAFVRSFRKVNMEVAGVYTGNRCTGNAEKHKLEAIASDAVGSTAVVTLISSTHIIVANCGDSRAVLCQGKECVPLSLDHKPGRNDERKRIEAAGGMVIFWGELRVSGVLAMSRSIGDRYLAPYVIPDPEMMFVPRAKEDECLILATDGLWDVVTNEEACDLARKIILLWYKKNGSTLNPSGQGSDPAAQEAASYLSRLALQRGSKDNISVIVIDLKAHRKFKKKTETVK